MPPDETKEVARLLAWLSLAFDRATEGRLDYFSFIARRLAGIGPNPATGEEYFGRILEMLEGKPEGDLDEFVESFLLGLESHKHLSVEQRLDFARLVGSLLPRDSSSLPDDPIEARPIRPQLPPSLWLE